MKSKLNKKRKIRESCKEQQATERILMLVEWKVSLLVDGGWIYDP